MATNKPLFAVQSQNRELVNLCGIFSSQTTAGVTALTGARGWSVTRTGLGIYTVSLSGNGYPYAVNIECGVIGSSTVAANVTVQASPLVQGSGTTPQSFVICSYAPTNVTTNTPTAADVPTGYQVSFRLDVLNSSVV